MAPLDNELLAEVCAAYERVEDVRLRSLLLAAVRYLHAFAAEVELTREEWMKGLKFLTSVGQACREGRQEFVLLSDLLGFSTAVDRLDYDAATGDTPSSVEGPYFLAGSPEIPVGGTIVVDEMDGAEAAIIRGHVTNRQGVAVRGAVLDIWQTAPNRLYAAADSGQSEFNLRGRQRVDNDGYYEFRTVKPVPYSVPGDGPCGALLAAARGHGMRAAHIHIAVSAPGYKLLVTQICPSGDRYIDSDAAFSIAEALVVDFLPSGDQERGGLVAEFDFVLKPS